MKYLRCYRPKDYRTDEPIGENPRVVFSWLVTGLMMGVFGTLLWGAWIR